MQNVPEQIYASAGQSNDTPLIVAAMFVFVSVFVILAISGQYFVRRAEIRRRALAPPRGRLQPSAVFEFVTAGGEDRPRSPGMAGPPDASEIVALAESGFAASRSTVGRELVRAGFFKGNAVYWFYACRLALAIVLPAGLYLFVELAKLSASSTVLAAQAAVLVFLGLMLPNFYVARRQQRIRQECIAGFPDFMDLMVVCAEAGLSPRASLDQVARELIGSFPYLGANLYLTSLELRAGRPLHEAIDNLERRVRIDEIKSLGSLLRQAEELGSSLTQALQVFSEEMRDKRLTRAEERAHALPVKLVFPLAIYVFPVMLVVIMLPLAIRIKTALF